MSVVKLARPEIQNLQPYKAAMQVDDTVRLNANEAPWNSSGDRFRRPDEPHVDFPQPGTISDLQAGNRFELCIRSGT